MAIRRKPKTKDFYPLIGRIRVADIIRDIKNNIAGSPLTNEELAAFLNNQLTAPTFRKMLSEQLDALGSAPFNSANILRLLHLDDDEGGFEVGLLQFVAIFTKYSFGELMMILVNIDSNQMSSTQALIIQCLRYFEISDTEVEARLTKLGGMGFPYSTYLQLKNGQLTPDDRQIRVLKQVLDPNEDVVSEAQWLRARSQDRQGGTGSGPAFPLMYGSDVSANAPTNNTRIP
jgi:hypothetical protein